MQCVSETTLWIILKLELYMPNELQWLEYLILTKYAVVRILCIWHPFVWRQYITLWVTLTHTHTHAHTILTAIFQVNLGKLVALRLSWQAGGGCHKVLQLVPHPLISTMAKGFGICYTRSPLKEIQKNCKNIFTNISTDISAPPLIHC